MMSRALLIQCVLLVFVSETSAQERPLGGRYGPTLGDQSPDAAENVPDIRPSLPPADRFDGGGTPLGREEVPRVLPFSADPRSTTVPGAAAEPKGARFNRSMPRQPFRASHQPETVLDPPAGGAFRAGSSFKEPPSTGLRHDQSLTADQFLTAKEWIAELLTEPAGGALFGQPITLQDALQGTRGETRQRAIIDAYWRLSRSVANYHVAVQVLGATERKSVRPGSRVGLADGPLVGRLRLDAARAKLVAVEAQAGLARFIDWSKETFPLPTSMPHVGSYRTRYEEIFSNRTDRKALRLHFLLPAHADVLRAHAQILNALASGGEGEFADAFQEQCREFLDAAYQYNHNIAEYVLLATNDGDGADLVPMLIKVERSDTNRSDIAADVVPALSTQESGESGVEHSVLVQPENETNLVPVRGNAARTPAGIHRHQHQPPSDQGTQPGRWQRH